MRDRPKLVLVPNCGRDWKKSRRMRRSAGGSRRRLLVQPLINAQLPAGDDLKLVGAPLRDNLSPLGDRPLADVEGLGQRLSSLEVPNGSGLKHGPESYSMLNPRVKDGKPISGIRCPGMETDTDNLGSRIKMLRESKGLTQEELGKMVGVTKGAVSQWEHGVIANIKLLTVIKLCDVLGTNLHYLVKGETRRMQKAS